MLPLLLVACDPLRSAVHELTAPEAPTADSAEPEPTVVVEARQTSADGSTEVRVEVSAESSGSAVVVGGEKGVIVGDHDEVTGVRVGGEKGVVIGRDDETRGVRVGGEKGVEVGKGGISIGGRTIVGSGKKEEKKEEKQ